MTESLNVEMNAHICSSCGIVFGLTAEFQAEHQRTHQNFYCPRGCSLYFAPPLAPQPVAEVRIEYERFAADFR